MICRNCNAALAYQQVWPSGNHKWVDTGATVSRAYCSDNEGRDHEPVEASSAWRETHISEHDGSPARTDDPYAQIKGGPFEAAVRKRLGVDDTYAVSVDVSGGQQVQIGDYTWDSEPLEFSLSVVPQQPMVHEMRMPGRRMSSYSEWERGQKPDEKGTVTWVSLTMDRTKPSFSRDFDDIPAIWAWIAEPPETLT